MKRILLILLMMGGIAYGQCPQVTGLSVSSLSTTGGKASYTAASGATLYVWGIYIPGGAFVTGGSTTSTTFNFTGLTASTIYRLKVRTTCGLSVSGDDSLTFSTLSASAMYTPLTAQGYQIKYLKADSGFNLPLRDTALLRGIDQAGAQVYKPGSGVFVYNGSYWQGISGGTGTIIITDSSKGIDSITFNGYQECIYLHDSITPTCWQLNRFFDDVRLSDDSLWYKYYNAGSVVDSVPSGIKNVGAVWPLSYNGVDLTYSKPFSDSLYLSSLVLHGTSLYSKKLTGDSVFVGTMGAGGSTGIDSMYVTTDSLYQVFIYHSGRRDSVGYSGSSGTGGSSISLTYAIGKYLNAYGNFVSFNDSARAAISLTTTGTSGASTYNSSTGVLNVPTYTLAGLGGISLSSLSATGTGISYNNATGVFTGSALIAADTNNIRFRPIAGSNITLSGTYPNITIASSGGGGGGQADSTYFWPLNGKYTAYGNFLGIRNNHTLFFKTQDTVRMSLDSAYGGKLKIGDHNSTSGQSNIVIDPKALAINFNTSGSNLLEVGYNHGNGFSSYNNLTSTYSDFIGRNGNFDLLQPATQYSGLIISGNVYTSGNAIEFKSGFDATPTRMLIYGNSNTDRAPISLFPSGSKGSVIVGGSITDTVSVSSFTVIDVIKGSIPAPRMTTAQRTAITSGVKTGTTAGGTGYTNGTFNNTSFTGGTGTGAKANMTVSGGIVQTIGASSITAQGTGYIVGDVLSASLAGGSGFTFTITAITASGAEGIMVYDLTLHKHYGFDGTTWNALY